MTWLPIDAGERAERDAVFGLVPEVYDGLREMLALCWRITDAALLDLCRLRLAQLTRCRAELAGVDERLLAGLEDWHRGSAFDGRQLAALALAEQYHFDHHWVTDEQKDDLAGHLGQAGLVNFVWALQMNDAYIRSLSLLDIAPDPPMLEQRAERTPRPRARSDATRLVIADGDGEGRDLRDPELVAMYGRLGALAVSQSRVDDVTSEAIRLRNADHQSCRY